ncbi:Z1 domain-containing protein [Planctomycetota bacterium]|nr:Z1 domain-containing protein [Planctomycetota bacterium]
MSNDEAIKEKYYDMLFQQSRLSLDETLIYKREANLGYVFEENEFADICKESFAAADKKFKRLNLSLPVEDCNEIEEGVLRTLRTKYVRAEAVTSGGSTSYDDDVDGSWYQIDKRQARFWSRYVEKVKTDKVLGTDAAEMIDLSTDDILLGVGNPQQEEGFQKRGLVIGDVQSGKTANMAGVIAKALDVGYQDIIVLAGPWESLRFQTQIRLCQDIAGYTLTPDKLVGVGSSSDLSTLKGECALLTTQAYDFEKEKADGAHRDFFPVYRSRLFVVKKNVHILKNLYEWLSLRNEHEHDFNRPVLIVDDECDFYSVDTSDVLKGEDPKAINRGIRKLWSEGGYKKVTYIGYTATPYANCLINRNPESADSFGEDIFPRDFMHVIDTPPAYLGVEDLLGTGLSGSDDEDLGDDVVNLIDVTDHDRSQLLGGKNTDGEHQDGFMPQGYKNFDLVGELPDTLINAVYDFVLGTAAKWVRDEIHSGIERMGGNEPTSMLVHVVVNVDAHEQITGKLTMFKNQLLSALEMGQASEEWEKMRLRWEKEFLPITESIRGKISDPYDALNVSWDAIREKIKYIAEEKALEIRASNSQSGSGLNWEDYKSKAVIFVGGLTLSRGITLKNLITSYFVKHTKKPAYDTLMQMGRWFGYKPRFRDLSRIYMQQAILDKYREISLADEHMRDEVRGMNAKGLKPSEIQIKIASSPGALITSRAKQKNPHLIQIEETRWGKYQALTNYSICEETLNNNVEALSGLINAMPEAETVKDIQQHEDFPNHLDTTPNVSYYRNVNKDKIIRFIEKYQSLPGNASYLGLDIQELLRLFNEDLELAQTWTVVIRGLKEDTHGKLCALPGWNLHPAKRDNVHKSWRATQVIDSGAFTISSLRGRTRDIVADVLFDITDNSHPSYIQYQQIPGRSGIHELLDIRVKESAVLIIEPFYGKFKNGEYFKEDIPFIGWGLSLPVNTGDRATTHTINPTI